MKVLIQIFFAILAAFGLTAILVAWLLYSKDLKLRKIHWELDKRNRKDEDDFSDYIGI